MKLLKILKNNIINKQIINKENNKIKIAVYFTEKDENGYPFNVPEYKKSYFDFFDYSINKHENLEFYIVRGNSYLGNGIFINGQKYNPESRKLIKINGKIQTDIIYNKGDLLIASDDNGNIVNHPKFDRLCKDKMRTALLFPNYSPSSIEVHSEEELKRAAKRVPGKKVVIKPVYGQEGKGVEIKSEKNAEEIENNYEEPLIVQEFLDTTKGIEGLTKDIHDLRILIMNGEIIQVYIRTPKKGKMISNVSKGGKLKEISVNELPDEIIDIVKKIDNKLSKYTPRIYSIDFGYTKNGPKIFELNSQPGLPFPQWKKYYKKWHEKLLETLLSSLNDEK